MGVLSSKTKKGWMNREFKKGQKRVVDDRSRGSSGPCVTDRPPRRGRVRCLVDEVQTELVVSV